MSHWCLEFGCRRRAPGDDWDSRNRTSTDFPGVVFTARNAPRLSDPAHRERAEQRIPLGRLGSPKDLVGAALLLSSDAGSYINGASLVVDGGFSVA